MRVTELPAGTVVEELVPGPDPAVALQTFAHRPHCLFLDSAMRSPELGCYSFLMADPVAFASLPGATDAWPLLGRWLDEFRTPAVPGLPPFQGGPAGLFGYELARQWEQLPQAPFNEFALPTMAVGLYDVVLAFDHRSERCWLISQGLPERDPAARRRRAAARLNEMKTCLSNVSALPPPPGRAPLASELAPQYRVGSLPNLTSNFSAQQYLDAVATVIEYIRAGDVFQVNLAQRLLLPAHRHPLELYLRLRTVNAAPFAAYFDVGPVRVLSASPERFLTIRQGAVETRPIKGTCDRLGNPGIDHARAARLAQSVKDRAENVMIVDLLRNDLSRVCTPESVRVAQLCGVEAYPHVFHLVSAVRGQLRDDAGPLDLLAAAFPGGSVTGAPKLRAIEIIAELEPTVRGPYCGALGYLGLDGSLDMNLLIRTISDACGWWQAPVGGGITTRSDPQREYEETWHKARGLLEAMQ